MLHLNTEHANVEPISLEPLEAYTSRLREIRANIAYKEYESSIRLPNDAELLERVKALAAEKAGERLRFSIVVGIGGSNLGTKAVYDALFGARDILEPTRFPKMLFAETTDPEWLAAVQRLLETLEAPDDVLVTVISKSGGTTETMANFEVIMQTLSTKFGAMESRVVAITDEGSQLWEAAGERGIARLDIPKPVGGRYSVLSAVGLLPLASVGVNIERLRAGASDVLDLTLGGDNISARSAAVLAMSRERGCVINDNFFFHPELESVGKWYRQLMGESVGKERTLKGADAHIGITPTVSLGSTDLHSVGQLYLGGPKDKLATFVSTAQSSSVTVPNERMLPSLVPMVTGKSAAEVLAAILEGVQIAYQKAGLPYMQVILDDLSEYSIGAYLQFKMVEMMYLGQLLDVNSFDQPNVELYKIETRRLLETAS